MNKFVGRIKELAILENIKKRPTSAFIVIQGRRRIGKSRLVEEFAKQQTFLQFVGLAPTEGIDAQAQRDEFARKLGEYFGLPGLKATDWADLFTVLANQTRQTPCIILLDEISWMAHNDATFLPKLKNAWDTQLKQNSQLLLIVCGSVSSWINENILLSKEFVGRITQSIPLKELLLHECNQFWGQQAERLSAYEKLTYLSISGGVPLYLEAMNPQLTAEDNISQLAFTPGSLFLNEFRRIFTDLFGRKTEVYEKIVRALVSGPKELTAVADLLKINRSGWLSSRMDELIAAGFITRDYTWNINTGDDSKLSQYRLSDNYLRFYLKYIEHNTDKINRGSFTAHSLYQLDNWSSLVGLQFENLVLHNRQSVKNWLHIESSSVISDNPFFQHKTSKQAGCQIDYLIQTKFNNLYVCEIKFSRKALGLGVVAEVQEKLKRLKIPKRFSVRTVLIHVNGVNDAVIDSQYFTNIINFSDLLEQAKTTL